MRNIHLVISLSLVVISIILMCFFPFSRIVKVVYVSHEEIISLEKQRIKDLEDKNLFFGKISEAIKLVEKISARQGDNRTIVIYSISPVYTKGVRSVSLKVHREVIDELKRSLK